jgi:hypothetical protein
MATRGRFTDSIVAQVRLAAAWALALAVVAAGATAAFRGVDARARAAFAEHRRLAPAPQAAVGEVVGSVAVVDDVVVRHEFDVADDGLTGLRLRTVTWGATPEEYGCHWSLVEVAADGRSLGTVRSGTLSPAAATDWGYAELRFDPIIDSAAARYALRITTGPGPREKPLGLPLFRPVEPAVDVSVRQRHGGPRRDLPLPAVLDVQPVHVPEGA